MGIEHEESGELERKWLRHRFQDFCLRYGFASTVRIDDIQIADHRWQYPRTVTSMDHRYYSHGLTSRGGWEKRNLILKRPATTRLNGEPLIAMLHFNTTNT